MDQLKNKHVPSIPYEDYEQKSAMLRHSAESERPCKTIGTEHFLNGRKPRLVEIWHKWNTGWEKLCTHVATGIDYTGYTANLAMKQPKKA